jgi:3'(2'), 5'-bisphosphate nucleotidase
LGYGFCDGFGIWNLEYGTMDYTTLLPIVINAAEQACGVIMDVYVSGDFGAELKGDNSPLTIADKRAHGVIVAALAGTGLPVLSEEGSDIPYEVRKDWPLFWMVDPLDGTKEFLKQNGEFTVNIALIESGVPVLGVVAVPVSGDVYYGAKGGGAFLKRDRRVMQLKREPVDPGKAGLRVVASRSHMNAETQDFLAKMKDPELLSKGSSLKFMLLAEGLADVYPRLAPTMEWDTAAAHAVLREAGMEVRQWGKADPLTYNKLELLNPYFLAG